jgi:hypothetical protein
MAGLPHRQLADFAESQSSGITLRNGYRIFTIHGNRVGASKKQPVNG